MHHLRNVCKRGRNHLAPILKGCIGIAFLIGLLLPTSTAFAYTNSAHIARASSIANDDTTACTASNNNTTQIYCIAPTVTSSASNNSTCSSNTQNQGPTSTNDGRTNIEWTYTEGNTNCMTVTWNTNTNLPGGNGWSCKASMYIPIHDATAILQYHLNYGQDLMALSPQINQFIYTDGAFVDLGPVHAMYNNTLSSITVMDNIEGQYQGKIGWGTDASHSLKITCSHHNSKS